MTDRTLYVDFFVGDMVIMCASSLHCMKIIGFISFYVTYPHVIHGLFVEII